MQDERSKREHLNEGLVRSAVRLRALLVTLLRPGSVIVFVVVSIAGAAASLRQANIPSARAWKPGKPLGIGFAIVGALAYLGYLLVVIGYRRTLRHSDQHQRLYATCRDMATLVDRETALDLSDIAVHVWAVRGMRGLRRLERRATFVTQDRPASPITWRRGEGVLGWVWESDRWVLADLEPLANAASEAEFYAIPREERFFFTWQEAQATAHYKGILAWPLHGGPENAQSVIGCLSIDAQVLGGATELGGVWGRERQTLSAHVAVCEAVLASG